MGIDVELADVGGNVEKERKPAYPAKELHLTDHSNPGRQSADGREYLSEEGEETRVV